VTPAPVSAALSGLTPGVTYHYRLVATNADGSTPGPDRTFTTPTTISPPGGGQGGPPRFLSASVNPRVFAVTPTHNAAPKRARPHAHLGTTFNFRLSEAARVTVKIERAFPDASSAEPAAATPNRTTLTDGATATSHPGSSASTDTRTERDEILRTDRTDHATARQLPSNADRDRHR
jgi:hypothetical protein